MKRIFLIVVLMSLLINAQNISEQLKQEALTQMKSGKYGEAIELLNRYISANPQNPTGYNLRGLSYEKRGMYEMAVYDFKSARKLAPKDAEISKNLSRTTESWYKLLYNKIEGHKREIAVDPSKPVNYLEIGKSYKNLGEWLMAEKWYDEYLKREEASPDEIIRYTEILAKNNHISKGEPILKRYVEEYPDDQRLWSRYGYFTMWLGKKKIAIKAFENSLAIKPYFQEAMDGLDLAKGKGYIYTVNDTSYRYSKTQGMVSKKPRFEYPIDRLTRLLKKSPEDNDLRFQLVQELIKAKRYEEAFVELEILSGDPKAAGKYDSYISDVKTKRDSLIEIRVAEYILKIEKNPGDKDAVKRLAVYYAGIQEYEKALAVLDGYISKLPDNDAEEYRFMYARYAAWDYRFGESLRQLEILLKYHPDNPDYQLLRGQVAVWTDQELNKGDFYLSEVLKKNPDNLPALIASASLKIKQHEFAAAKTYIEKAQRLAPDDKDVEAIAGNYEVNLTSFELYNILYSARDLVEKGDCQSALVKYDEYLSRISAPSRLERIEYASIYVCTGENDKASAIYTGLLEEEYEYDIALLRAKTYFWSGDSIAALNEFTKLRNENPDDFEAELFYGFSLAANHEYSVAEEIYDGLLSETSDSTEIKRVLQAKSWLPQGNYGFPKYIALSPQVSFYDDNQAFTLNNTGIRMEVGLTSFLSAGATFLRTNISTTNLQRNLNSVKGNLYINFSKRVQLSGGFGSLSTKESSSKNVYDATLRYTDELFTGYLYYDHNDARTVLYSRSVIDSAMTNDLGRAGFTYRKKSGLRASGQFSYLDLSDDNTGNDLLLRIGKDFNGIYAIGYEYQYLNYSVRTPLYWSPANFDSHSLWGDWEVLDDKEDNIKINLGGRIGYISEGDFMIREISGDFTYKPLPYFVLVGRLTTGSTYRFDTSYNYVSAAITAYWSIY
jgi:Flp pilus assembly protein TadD